MGIGFLDATFLASLVSLSFVAYLSFFILSKPQGTERMVAISRQIQIGARAFLMREYSYVFPVVLTIAVIFSVVGYFRPEFGLGWKTALAFVFGACASTSAGFLGMSIATRSNARTTQAAVTGGVKAALDVALSGGAVMGIGVVGISLLGLVIVYYVFNGDPVSVNGYSMGCSLLALFARSGGGIYTKGADMGADLVGKIEAGIPEDDPRNPAVIADNVGDNVGDVAGLGADLLESYVASIIASLAIAFTMNSATYHAPEFVVAFPFILCVVGAFASIAGVMYVKVFGKQDPQKALMMGTYVAAILTVIGIGFYSYMHRGEGFTLAGTAYFWYGPFMASVLGIVSGMVVGLTSEYFTSGDHKPVRRIAEGCQSGPAIGVTEGTAVGMQSVAVPIIVLALANIGAFYFGGVYGVAIASLGMLATTGIVVAVDSYGPIADNAGGMAEMAKLPHSVRDITDNLDAVGNTTAAIGKGFAIGSAAFASIGLLSAFMLSAKLDTHTLGISNPRVLSGILIGGMIPFFFSSMLFRAVGRCAFDMINEVRRQFKEIPGLKEGLEGVFPDSAKCVDIAAKGAITGMMVPGIMAILAPVVVGFLIGKDALAGLLVGAICTGLMLGIQTANSGGAMDNAKKYIEAGNFGGKGSDAHKAAIVGDTVGDPLKDTVGPSLNILIKLMCTISLVLAPLFT